MNVTPTQTTTYTITVTNSDGTTATDSATVNVGPQITLTANPTEITSGEFSNLTWTSVGAESVTIDNGVGSVLTGAAPNSRHTASQRVTPTTTTTYTATARSANGQTATASVTITVGRIPTVSISANPLTIQSGNSSTLTWTSTNAATASIDNGVGTVPINGSRSVSPTGNTTYTITVTSVDGNTATDSVTIAVTAGEPRVSLNADPTSIIRGNSSTLSWASSNATSASIDNGIGTVGINGSMSVSPTQTTTYTITVRNADGRTSSDTATITVTEPPPDPPQVTLIANPSSIEPGGSSTLTWNSVNATSARMDNGIGTVGINGSMSVSPTQTTTYTITVVNSANV